MKFSHCVDVFSGLPRFPAAQHVFCNQWQHLLCHYDPRVLLILELYLLQFFVILLCMSGVTFQRKFLTTCNIFVLILKHFPWNKSTAWMWKSKNLTCNSSTKWIWFWQFQVSKTTILTFLGQECILILVSWLCDHG